MKSNALWKVDPSASDPQGEYWSTPTAVHVLRKITVYYFHTGEWIRKIRCILKSTPCFLSFIKRRWKGPLCSTLPTSWVEPILKSCVDDPVEFPVSMGRPKHNKNLNNLRHEHCDKNIIVMVQPYYLSVQFQDHLPISSLFTPQCMEDLQPLCLPPNMASQSTAPRSILQLEAWLTTLSPTPSSWKQGWSTSSEQSTPHLGLH